MTNFEKLRSTFLITFFMVWRISLPAQSGLMSDPNWRIKPYINTAALIQHHSSMGNLITGYPVTYELNIIKPSLGDKSWQLENNFPDYGINVSVVDYANHKELGYGIVLAPFCEIPLNKNVRASRLFLRLCWGVSYMTNHFNIRTNQKNSAIGSAFNAYVQFKWYWRIPLNQKMEIEPGFMFSHVSNGRSQSPNLGLNIFGAGIGLNFRVTDKPLPPVEKVSYRTIPRSRHELTILNSYGMNDGAILGPKYLTSCLSFGYNYNKRNTHKFGAGFDIFYEQNYVKDLHVANIETDNGFQKLRYGPKVSYSYNIGSISLPIEMGMYVNQPIKPDGSFYNKLGIRYFGPKGLILAFGLRTHFAVAYNFDLGIGYRLPVGKKIERD